MTETECKKQISQLLTSQRLAVLSTALDDQPYASLVAFAATENLTGLVFVTSRATRKALNLMSQPRAALLIDSRENTTSDFQDAVALTATGVAKEAIDERREHLAKLLLAKHPYMEEFVQAPTTALFCVEVEKYLFVEQFQKVVELDTTTWAT